MKSLLLALLLPIVLSASAQKLREVKLPELLTAVQQQTDTLYVVNFWSTWCKPCVAEMPYFEQANNQYKSSKVKVVLVSLDFIKDKARVQSFVEKKQLSSQVYLLNESNPNQWINKVDSTWSGAIPATIFYSNGKKLLFRESEFTQQELNSTILQLLKQ